MVPLDYKAYDIHVLPGLRTPIQLELKLSYWDINKSETAFIHERERRKRSRAMADAHAVEYGRATSGPRRPSVRPATLLSNNIAIRPAKPQPKNAGFMSEMTRRTDTKVTAQLAVFIRGSLLT